MNSFNQIAALTISTHAAILIKKIWQNLGTSSLIPELACILASFLIMGTYKARKQQFKTILQILLMLVTLLINTQSKGIFNSLRYLEAGRILMKQSKDNNSIAFTLINIFLIIGMQVFDGFVWEQQSQETIVVIILMNMFFVIPLLVWRVDEHPKNIQKLEQREEQDKENQNKLVPNENENQDHTLLRDSKSQERGLLKQPIDTQTPSQSPFQSDFFEAIIKQYPEGILILGEKEETQFMSKSLMGILGFRTKKETVGFMMNMKNCFYEIDQQNKMHQMFQALKSKFSSSKSNDALNKSEKGDSDESIDLDFASFKSTSETIGEEYQKQINDMKSQLSQRRKQQQFIQPEQDKHQITFHYEVSMICSKENSNEMKSEHTQASTQQLFEISQRPFVYLGRPYIFLIVKDVTHFNQIKVLSAMNQNKSQMLSQVSHEFRTPLNCIILLVEALCEQMPSNVVQEYLQPVLISAKSLLSLINDLLDLAQLKAGKFKLVHEVFDIRQLLQEMQQLLSPILTQKSNALVIQVEANVPKQINADPNRVRQIILNLISNANKFTKNGCITISVDKETPNLISIAVKDTGLGIEKEDQAKLFQAFGKLEKGKEMNSQGVGLGLMISNVLAERLSMPDSESAQFGKSSNFSTSPLLETQGLKVNSAGSGKGCEFKFWVYCQKESQKKEYAIKVQDKALEKRQTFARIKSKFDSQDALGLAKITMDKLPKQSKARQSLELTEVLGSNILAQYAKSQQAAIQIEEKLEERLYVMIVDDESLNIRALTMALKKYSYLTVEGFGSGFEAVERVKEKLPKHQTVILQDLEMPLMDGFETTRQIRGIVGQQVYIVGCSGHSADMKTKCLERGMNDYVEKPVKIKELMKILDQFLN